MDGCPHGTWTNGTCECDPGWSSISDFYYSEDQSCSYNEHTRFIFTGLYTASHLIALLVNLGLHSQMYLNCKAQVGSKLRTLSFALLATFSGTLCGVVLLSFPSQYISFSPLPTVAFFFTYFFFWSSVWDFLLTWMQFTSTQLSRGGLENVQGRLRRAHWLLTGLAFLFVLGYGAAMLYQCFNKPVSAGELFDIEAVLAIATVCCGVILDFIFMYIINSTITSNLKIASKALENADVNTKRTVESLFKFVIRVRRLALVAAGFGGLAVVVLTLLMLGPWPHTYRGYITLMTLGPGCGVPFLTSIVVFYNRQDREAQMIAKGASTPSPEHDSSAFEVDDRCSLRFSQAREGTSDQGESDYHRLDVE